MDIRLTPTITKGTPNDSKAMMGDPNTNTSSSPMIVPLDHHPSWKLHKNPFWRVKHPQGSKLATVTPVTMTSSGELEVKPQPMYAYEASQDIGGVVTIHLPPGKKMEHLGIKIMFIGRIDMVRLLFLDFFFYVGRNT